MKKFELSRTQIYKISLRVFSLYIIYSGVMDVAGGRPGHGLINIGFGIYVALCTTDDVVALWAVRHEKLSRIPRKASPAWVSLAGAIGLLLIVTGIALQVF